MNHEDPNDSMMNSNSTLSFTLISSIYTYESIKNLRKSNEEIVVPFAVLFMF